MLNSVPRSDLRRATTYTIGLAALWFVVAAWRPEVTYHLAPLLVAAVPPIAITIEDLARTDSRSIVAAGLGGLLLSLVATTLLSMFGWLSGPSLLPAGGAATEAVVFSVAGTAIGTTVALVRARR